MLAGAAGFLPGVGDETSARVEQGLEGLAMPIQRILQNSPLHPEDIRRLVAAYEKTLQALGLKDRNDPITELVAKKIIEIGQTGVRDPEQISQRAIEGLGPDTLKSEAEDPLPRRATPDSA
jgi:hypothetical protein